MQQNIDPETPAQRKARYWRMGLSAFFLLGAFAIMIFGMIGKVYYDHLTKDTVFSLSQILVPVLVAPMVYGVIYSFLKTSTDVVPALILAFQNGFFWQDVFSGIRPPQAPAHTEILHSLLSFLF